MKKNFYFYVMAFILFWYVQTLCAKVAHLNIHNVKLATLNKKIEKLSQQVEAQGQAKKELARKMQQQKRSIAVMNKRICELKVHHSLHQKEQHQLNAQYNRLNTQLSIDYRRLENLLKVIYSVYYCNLSSSFSYYHYLYYIQTRKIYTVEQQLIYLNEKNSTLQKKMQELESRLAVHQQKYKMLDRQQNHSQKTLNILYTQLKQYHERLTRLLKNKQDLEVLMKELAKKSRDEEERYAATQDEKSRKDIDTKSLYPCYGKLPWPIKGKIIRRYHQKIEHSEIFSTGVLMKATASQEVHAIQAGRIVFATELRGLGLLIVIQHHQGDLSLYGHNQHLLKKVGDTVQATEKIATLKANHLFYFEIRHQEKAVDPEKWCLPLL